jgi:hypothetical protein
MLLEIKHPPFYSEFNASACRIFKDRNEEKKFSS